MCVGCARPCVCVCIHAWETRGREGGWKKNTWKELLFFCYQHQTLLAENWERKQQWRREMLPSHLKLENGKEERFQGHKYWLIPSLLLSSHFFFPFMGLVWKLIRWNWLVRESRAFLLLTTRCPFWLDGNVPNFFFFNFGFIVIQLSGGKKVYWVSCSLLYAFLWLRVLWKTTVSVSPVSFLYAYIMADCLYAEEYEEQSKSLTCERNSTVGILKLDPFVSTLLQAWGRVLQFSFSHWKGNWEKLSDNTIHHPSLTFVFVGGPMSRFEGESDGESTYFYQL